MSAITEPISVGIATRNRRGSLVRCLASLALIDGMIDEVLVVDDTSDQPLGDLAAELPPAIARKLRVIEQPGRQGPIVARNTTVRTARNECVLLMDDDAYVIDAEAIRRGVEVFNRHDEVGARNSDDRGATQRDGASAGDKRRTLSRDRSSARTPVMAQSAVVCPASCAW